MNRTISESVTRVDGPDKTAGLAVYVDDVSLPGMLHARTLRSDRPRARIRTVRIPDLPAGCWIVDRNDVPGINRIKMLENDWPFFAEEVINHVGEPILLVVGEDPAVVDRVLRDITVEYEDLKPILDVNRALAPRHPIFNDDNCFAAYTYAKGDPDAAFASAHRVVEGEYRTGLHEQAYMEPQGMIGQWVNGRVIVSGSMQCPYYVKRALEQVTGLTEDRVQVVQTTTGGAFGGKEEYPSLLAGQVAVAAMKTGRPVKLVLERGDDMIATTKRHPSVCRYRTALDADGRILAMEADITLDGGAYAGLSAVVLQRALFAATGVYRMDHCRVTGRALATNHVPSGAFRGFGAPQAFFAVESHMDDIAGALGEDPLAFRMRHLLRTGDTSNTGGVIRDRVPLPDLVKRVLAMSGYHRRREEAATDTGPVKRGIGISLFFHGCGFTGKGEEIIRGTARLHKRADGTVEILVANVEMGQGAQTAFRKIVAAKLGIPITQVVYDNPDTDRVPDSGPTVASRTIMVVGHLLAEAATELKERMQEPGDITVTRTYRHPAYIEWDQDTLQGDAYPTYSWGAAAVEVSVDTVTAEVTPSGVWAAFDIGTAIDRRMLEGQLQGGLLQGVAYGGLEVMETGNGAIRQHNFTDYVIPTSVDTPPIHVDVLDNPYEHGPFGAKCAGELPLVGGAPAFASAVRHATGRPVRKIPVKPETLLGMLEKQ